MPFNAFRNIPNVWLQSALSRSFPCTKREPNREILDTGGRTLLFDANTFYDRVGGRAVEWIESPHPQRERMSASILRRGLQLVAGLALVGVSSQASAEPSPRDCDGTLIMATYNKISRDFSDWRMASHVDEGTYNKIKGGNLQGRTILIIVSMSEI